MLIILSTFENCGTLTLRESGTELSEDGWNCPNILLPGIEGYSASVAFLNSMTVSRSVFCLEGLLGVISRMPPPWVRSLSLIVGFLLSFVLGSSRLLVYLAVPLRVSWFINGKGATSFFLEDDELGSFNRFFGDTPPFALALNLVFSQRTVDRLVRAITAFLFFGLAIFEALLGATLSLSICSTTTPFPLESSFNLEAVLPSLFF
mmetsp:Transcript_7641/g.11856  ORF Transcript_7641/g.11856 Transcript_7641/m.11856 type:complete len:205 (-) Transcript_7641:555-1169(-)